MKRLLSFYLATAAIALIAPRPGIAANLTIIDNLASETITFAGLNDFEGGFFLDGTLVQSGLNNEKTVTVAEASATGAPITHTFSGSWITGGLTPSSGVIAFLEEGTTGASDILRFSYTGGGLGGNLTGSFVSDIDPGVLPIPTDTTQRVLTESFVFNNGNITASATSDVPEPATLALLGTALLGFGFYRRRRQAM